MLVMGFYQKKWGGLGPSTSKIRMFSRAFRESHLEFGLLINDSFMFPKKEALAGSKWCLFIKRKFMPSNFRCNLTSYIAIVDFCMSKLFIMVMNKWDSAHDTVVIVALFILDFGGSVFLEAPSDMDHQYGPLKLSLIELFSELASTQASRL